jgi:hypothetical protein
MRTHDNNAKRIARLVILAQDASDAGKHIDALDLQISRRYTRREGYAAKNVYILAAIKIIVNSKPCGWNFYVDANRPDQNGYSSVITYFQYKLDGVRYEVSFHTPASQAGALKPFFGKGRKTHWNGVINGSRADCQTLADIFNL